MNDGRRTLVATDIDGTLVPDGTLELPAYTADVLRRLDTAGVPVVFVTGRPLRWMTGFWPHVGHHGMAIVSNGAITYDAHAREIVSFTGIAAEEGLALSAAISAALPGARFAIECADGIRLDPRFAARTAVAEAPRGPLPEIWTDPAMKLLVRDPDVDADLLQGEIATIVGDAATVTWTMPGLVEISAAGVTKASALHVLCERLGVDPDKVIAFGDMPNDIPMLSWAGTSYAMAGAHPTVREIADRTAPPTADEGVAQVLEHLFAPA
ncbi:HAD family hydrolase [Microbacterium sp. ET2]|uniref:HAD family hydrolase n=1 Tax=Microbacterium albipurpureum TaxID=3050384 RepID=UPI00259CEAD5|nr:HAD family hydrolase [Microbacterium sp. ET2 (Ac-2212)]WJL94871.1 HAD family hydrolase [Microbacterium sp. ET2 (Ac-2212)]